MESVTITRHQNGDAGEYHAHVAGSALIGRLTWTERPNPAGTARAAEHTLVPPPIGNRGIAARLVEEMVADARREGFKILPLCSYVVAAFRRHPDWADVQA
ncbi:MAG: GNAT family N-acetyltransferase [Novosphingobium sp.]